MTDKPVWDKPRPKGLGKPSKLSSGQKASAKAAAKAAGRPWPNLVDNMRAARKARAFGGEAYTANSAVAGMDQGGVLGMMPQGANPNLPNAGSIPSAAPVPTAPPPQLAQQPIPNMPMNTMSGANPAGMAKGGAVENALRLAKKTPILNNYSGEKLPMRPYGPRYNPETDNLDSKNLKDIGYYGALRDPEGYQVTEYSGNRGNFTYPTIHQGMSDSDLAATMMHEHLGKPKYEGEDIISERLNKAEPKIPFPKDVDQRAYEAAQDRVSEGRSPYFEQGKDKYPAWSPEQYWEEPAAMPKAKGGAVENALRVAKLRLDRHKYATDGAVEGEVSFAPEEKPDYEKASQFEQEQLQSGEPQLPQMDRQAYNNWKYGAADALHGMAYLHPATAPMMGAYDFGHGAATGNPKEMAGAMFGLPSRVAKAIATTAFAEQPESEGASPAAKLTAIAKDRMNKGGMVEKALQLASGGGAWTRKEGQNPAGGLNSKGRASLKAQGHDIKPPAPHPKTEKDANRRKSFCARMSGMQGPMKDEKGRPTRKALSLKAWNC